MQIHSVKTQFIKDFEHGTEIDTYFAVISKSAPRTYRNKPGVWFTITISDKTGVLPVKFWGGTDEEPTRELFASFKVQEVITVKGTVLFDDYSNGLAVSINEGEGHVKKEAEYDSSDFVPRTEKDIEQMKSHLKNIIEEIQDPHIKKLLKSFFDDEEFMQKYAYSPAAMKNHHSYIGGLIEHVLSMIEMSKTVAKIYEPDLNLDLMIAGCILHDLGKIIEYEVGIGISFSAKGSLLGHISIGAKIVQDKIAEIEREEGIAFPEITKDKIIHLILSHHGEKEKGSPVTPSIPEAIALHKIDDCDAQVKMMMQLKKSANSDDEMIRTREFGDIYLK